MRVRRVIQKQVQSCSQCPYFNIWNDMGSTFLECQHPQAEDVQICRANESKINEKCPIVKKIKQSSFVFGIFD